MPLPQKKDALAYIAARCHLPEAWLRYLAAFPRPKSDPNSPPWDEGPEAWSAAMQSSKQRVSDTAAPLSSSVAQGLVRQQPLLPLEQSLAAAEEHAVSAPASAPRPTSENKREQAHLYARAEHSQLPTEQLQQLSSLPQLSADPLSPPWNDPAQRMTCAGSSTGQHQPASAVKATAGRAAYVPVSARSTERMTPLDATLQVQAAVEALQTGVVSNPHAVHAAPFASAPMGGSSTAATGTMRRSSSTRRSRKDPNNNVVVTQSGERVVVSPLQKRNQQVELVSAAAAQQIVSRGKVTSEGLVRAGKAKIVSLIERVQACVQPDFVICKQDHMQYQEQFTVSNNRGLKLKIGIYYNKNNRITAVRANHQDQAFAPYLQRLCAQLIGTPLELTVSTTRGRKRS